jgi:hypothetical protein
MRRWSNWSHLMTHRSSSTTVQNRYPGDAEGRGGIFNFVTKRGKCAGANSKISWTQVETGSAIAWKYPSVILQGDNSVGEFYSVALTPDRQQADTGTKMIHISKNTRSTILSKGISAGRVTQALATLSPREAHVLRHRCGIGTHKAHTLTKVALDLGVTSQDVRQIEVKALASLRQMRLLQYLTDISNSDEAAGCGPWKSGSRVRTRSASEGCGS